MTKLNTKKQVLSKWTLGWGATLRCDLACAFCYSENSRKSSRRKDVDLEEAEKFLIRNLQEIESINFGTGESFLMPHFSKLLLLCKKHIPNVKIAVTSNGSLADHIEDRKLIQIYRNSIDELDVSLDFCNDLSHDDLRCKKGSWYRAIAAIELGRQLGIDVSIVMVGIPKTVEHDNLRGMLAIAKHFDVSLRINPYMPSSGDFSFALSYKQIKTMLHFLKENSDCIRTSDLLLSMLLSQDSHVSPYGHYKSLRILPDNKISPSTYLTSAPWVHSVNISEVRLGELEDLSNFKNWNQSVLPKECGNCHYLSRCHGGSRERRILWHGTLTERDPYCPMLQDEDVKIPPNHNEKVSAFDWNGPSIHLDYLPTILCNSSVVPTKHYKSCSKVIILDQQRKTVLLLKKRKEGYWDLPGGGVLDGESLHETLIREIREETGIENTCFSSSPPVKWASIQDGSILFGTTFVLYAKEFSPVLSNEHIEYKWVSLNDLSNHLKANHAWLKIYENHLQTCH